MRAARFVFLLAISLTLATAAISLISRRPTIREPRLYEGMSRTEAMVFDRACKDCHSNNTEWPWYSRLPPISLGVTADVRRGRQAWNISSWTTYSKGMKLGFLTAIAVDAVNDNMPPRAYRWMHPDSVLSAKDRASLAEWSMRERLRLRQGI